MYPVHPVDQYTFKGVRAGSFLIYQLKIEWIFVDDTLATANFCERHCSFEKQNAEGTLS